MALIGLLYSLFTSIGIHDLILIFTTSLLLYFGYFYYSYFTRENPLPGPLPLPFVGNILDNGFGDFVDYTERLRKIYGDAFEIYFGPKKFIMLSRYNDAQNMFDYSPNSKYLRRLSYMPGLEELDISGKGIAFNHDIGTWGYNRHFLSRALLRPSFSKYAVTCTHSFIEEMMEFWKDMLNDDGSCEIDIVEWSHRLTTDSISYFTTGNRIHTMEACYKELLTSQNKKPKKVSSNDTQNATEFFNRIQHFFASIYFFIIVPPWIRKHIPYIRNLNKGYLKNRDWLYSNVEAIIKQRRKEIDYTPLGQELRADLLTSMITANTDRDVFEFKFENKSPMADGEIRAVLWETFIGGIDTAANTFSFIIHYLANYPKVLRRLHVELDAFFIKLGDRRLDIEDLSDLVYTEAIIKEVLRIYTPAPYTARNSIAEDDVVGYSWPGGTQYIINVHGMNNNEKYWKEPEKFNPDRWININSAKNEKLSSITFGGGRRICPGRKLANIALKCMVALIYHKFDFELVDPNFPLKTKFNFTRTFGNLNVRIKPRKV